MIDPSVWVAAIGLVGIALAHWVGRRQRSIDVTRAVQDTYQELLADVTAQVAAAKQEATQAREAAREAQQMAQNAEADAWRADMRARAMERFLIELRPLIAAHVPGAEPILERLDHLTRTAAAS